jgi:molybdopterin/thiamine biosynthesis adenylyltransferase
MAELKIVDHTKDRYHALAISSVWELALLRKARALVVGAGALGNEVSKNLAMMGVQLIAVLDRDTVETANLSRSVFFRERDHGRPKTEVLSDRLRELNPDVEIIALNGDLNQELGLGLVRRMDMIFSCLDSRLARRTLNRMCGKVGKAWVDGAMENLLGEVAVYVPDQGPCYECSLTEMQKTLIAEAASCRGIALRNLALGKVPTTSTMGSIIAALQVQEAVKLLHADYKNALVGRSLVLNCNINDFYITGSERKADEDCDGHVRYGEVSEVPEFAAGKTSARTMLDRFREETGEVGSLNLGREVVTELYCPNCGKGEVVGEPIHVVHPERVRCHTCRQVREVKTTHEVRGHEPYVEWPLERLGIPKLDVLEVRGPNSKSWYELTGDLQVLPEVLQSNDRGAQGETLHQASELPCEPKAAVNG